MYLHILLTLLQLMSLLILQEYLAFPELIGELNDATISNDTEKALKQIARIELKSSEGTHDLFIVFVDANTNAGKLDEDFRRIDRPSQGTVQCKHRTLRKSAKDQWRRIAIDLLLHRVDGFAQHFAYVFDSWRLVVVQLIEL